MRTYVVGRQIFSQSLTNALLVSIETTVGTSIDSDKVKSVTVLPRNLFPTDACAYVTWMSPGVALLGSTEIFGKSVQTRLNFEPAELSERMES